MVDGLVIQAWAQHMRGRASVITSNRTFKLSPRVSVGGVSLLDRTLYAVFLTLV